MAPSIVDGIDREAISYDKLRINLENFNTQLINKIVIQRKQVELDKQNEDVATKLEKKQK